MLDQAGTPGDSKGQRQSRHLEAHGLAASSASQDRVRGGSRFDWITLRCALAAKGRRHRPRGTQQATLFRSYRISRMRVLAPDGAHLLCCQPGPASNMWMLQTISSVGVTYASGS